LPDTGDRHGQSSGSPLQRRAQDQVENNWENMQAGEEVLEEDEQMQEPGSEKCAGSSDDFGDDDFDDMVDALDTTPQTAEEPVQAKQDTSYVTIPTETIRPLQQQQSQVVSEAQAVDSDDEFGMDEDEDGFAADLEQVASLYDTRPVLSPSQQAKNAGGETRKAAAISISAPTTPIIDLEDDDEDDDEFGDEIDVDVFAAAEVAATQPSANNVRRTSTFP
jgi:DNA replication ATP-dependent helicase Dna2